MSEVSTHSRPKAAGSSYGLECWMDNVSTHSRPKAAGRFCPSPKFCTKCFNTQPPEGGREFFPFNFNKLCLFQHTAARRRPARGECVA